MFEKVRKAAEYFSPKQGRKIAVVGMPRAGSTALFDMVNAILESNHEQFQTHSYGSKKWRRHNKRIIYKSMLLKLRTRDTVVVKAHDYEQSLKDWADLIFLTRRDIRDSIASRRRTGKALVSKGQMEIGGHMYDPKTFVGFKKWCNYVVDDCYIKWLPVDYEFCFEKYKENRKNTVEEVASLLNVAVDPNEILCKVDYYFSPNRIVEETIGGKGTANGKVNNFENYLSLEELEYIEQNYPSWIDKF